MTDEAVDRFLAAGDAGSVAEVVRESWVRVMSAGRAGPLERLLDRLPTDVVLEDANLCVARAVAELLEGRPTGADPWLRRARRAPTDDGRAEPALEMARGLEGLRLGVLETGAAAARRAMECGLPPWAGGGP